MHDLADDLRYAIRFLLRNPGFAGAAIACLALGIGANSVMFGVVDTLFLRAPAHVRDPGRVARLYTVGVMPNGQPFANPSRSYGDYLAVRQDATALAEAAAYYLTDVAVGRGEAARQVPATLASHTFFSLLGVEPALGRFFQADDDRPGADPVAVISHGFWTSLFGRDTAALGRTLQIGSHYYTVVGVAPRGFRGVDLRPSDIWFPLGVSATDLMGPWAISVGGAGNSYWLSILGRLRAGASTAAAEQQAALAIEHATTQRPQAQSHTTIRTVLGPIQVARGPQRGQGALVAALVGGMSIVVLLIACANVANLLVARGLRRRREIAIRLAVGAGRFRLVRQFLVEAVLLAVLGACAALVLSLWAAPLMQRYLLPTGLAVQPLRDLRVLGFTAAVALATGVLSGLVPAIQATRLNLAPALAAGQREGGLRRSRVRSGILVGQVALSLVLVAGAGLFVRSLRKVQGLDLGLDARPVLAVTLNVHGAGLSNDEVKALYLRVLERVQSLPLVERASVSVGSPFSSAYAGAPSLPGQDIPEELKHGSAWLFSVTADHFATLGMRIVRGRGFTREDRAGAPKVGVLSERLAKMLWPEGNPIGQCFQAGDNDCTTLVGIVKDVPQFGIIGDMPTTFYLPLAQFAITAPTILLVRTVGRPEAAIPSLRREIFAVEPNLPYADITPLYARIEPQLKPWRLGGTMFGVYGGLALFLTALGLFGVLAYSVTQRTREIGIRMALGAERSAVLRLVLREGLLLALSGIVVGAALALAGGRFVASLLYGVSAHDPASLAVAAVSLLVAALLASYLPARRAASVDPMIALRSE
jgi:predicted permease